MCLFNKEVHIAFVDFEKAFHRVDRNLVWQVLEEWGYLQQVIKSIQGLYNGTRIAVKDNCRIS